MTTRRSGRRLVDIDAKVANNAAWRQRIKNRDLDPTDDYPFCRCPTTTPITPIPLFNTHKCAHCHRPLHPQDRP